MLRECSGVSWVYFPTMNARGRAIVPIRTDSLAVISLAAIERDPAIGAYRPPVLPVLLS
jgi:hypothetical protein